MVRRLRLVGELATAGVLATAATVALTTTGSPHPAVSTTGRVTPAAAGVPLAGSVASTASYALPAVRLRAHKAAASSGRSVGSSAWRAALYASATQRIDDIPVRALEAYQRASIVIDLADPSCHLDWTLLAALAKVESDHGRYAGAAVDADGLVHPRILGPRLTGSDHTRQRQGHRCRPPRRRSSRRPGARAIPDRACHLGTDPGRCRPGRAPRPERRRRRRARGGRVPLLGSGRSRDEGWPADGRAPLQPGRRLRDARPGRAGGIRGLGQCGSHRPGRRQRRRPGPAGGRADDDGPARPRTLVHRGLADLERGHADQHADARADDHDDADTDTDAHANSDTDSSAHAARPDADSEPDADTRARPADAEPGPPRHRHRSRDRRTTVSRARSARPRARA